MGKPNPYTNADTLLKNLQNEWELDPQFRYNPVTLDNVAIYHLVKYSDEEKIELEKKKQSNGLSNIVKIEQVNFVDVPMFVEKGFTVHQIYAKHVIMVKRKEVK